MPRHRRRPRRRIHPAVPPSGRRDARVEQSRVLVQVFGFAGAGVDAQVASRRAGRGDPSALFTRSALLARRTLSSSPTTLSHLTSSSWVAHAHPSPVCTPTSLPFFVQLFRPVWAPASLPSPLLHPFATALAPPTPHSAHGFSAAIHTNDIALAHLQTLRPSARALRPRVHCPHERILESKSATRAGALEFDALSPRWITVNLAKGPITLRTLYVNIRE